MKSATKIILFLTLSLLIGVAFFLVRWEIPAPIVEVDKVISDERFPK